MFEVFLERATQLSEGRRLMDGDATYPSALALLAVHSAISWNDAVLLKLRGSPFKGQDHMEAVRVTEKHCVAKRLGCDGISQLKKLIKEKSRVSYSDQRTTVEVAQTLSIAAERFEAWANTILKGLA